MMGEDGPAIIDELITVYLEDTPQRLVDIARALGQQDGEQIRRVAHAIKSASAAVGAMHVATAAAELEHHDGDHQTMGPGVAKLKNDFVAASSELTSLRTAIAA